MTKTEFYENEFTKAFSKAVECGITKENSKANVAAYNTLYAAGLCYLENVVMKYKNCAMKLRSIGYDANTAAIECASHIFWDRLDYIIAGGSESVIPLTVALAKSKVHDIFERETSVYNNLGETDEYGWSIMQSDCNVEDSYISRKDALEVIKALCENKNKFEAISFLATKLLGIKTGTLCRLLMSDKREETVTYILTTCADMLCLDKTFFENAVFMCKEIKSCDMSEKDFAKEISRASDRAKNKIRKSVSR
ncbi:MAG: hypothetical protein IKU61_05695 [Clostridia bacterium]|nr:hypothetical protein [Clostridia bacterium]